MRININEIAKKSGVSIATVSRVMNNKGPVKQETKQKILQIANELNYKPSPIARGLARKKTDTIGVILPELVDEFFMNIIRGIDEEADRHNRYLMVSSSHSQRNDVEKILEFMGSGRVDGVILMAPSMQKEIYDIISKSKRPVVLLNCYPEMDGLVSFGIDNYRGAYLITEHLISHGYKKIGMIKGPEINADANTRFMGFRDALEKNGINYDPSFVIPGDFSIQSGYHGFSRLMGQQDKVEAVFMANDMMAIGAYEAAKNINITIPNDVAVVGFDDIFPSRILTPRLTTVHIPIVELGSRAMNYLLKMIDGEIDPQKPHKEMLSTGLVIGGSCGCNNDNSRNVLP